MRCFIAIKLSKEVKEKVAYLQDKLRTLGLDAKWVEFENLHITLKFLGQVDKELSKIKDIVAGLSSLVEPFVLQLSGVGAFPDLRRPRILWLGISPQNSPVKIIEYLEEELFKVGIAKEKRTPHPHITLARIKSPKNANRLKDIMSLEIESIEYFGTKVTILLPRLP